MNKKILASILNDRESYESVAKYLTDPSDVFDDITAILYKIGSKFYENDESATSVDYEVIDSVLNRKHSKHYDMLSSVLEEVKGLEVSNTNLIKEFLEAKKYSVGLKLANKLLEGNTNTQELLEEFYTLSNSTELEIETEDAEVFQCTSLSDLSSELSLENRLKLYPDQLNDRLGGGAIREQQILVYARPEAGKSLFVINLTRGFIDQGLKVLYIGNEDPAKSMISRLYSSILGTTVDDVLDESNDSKYTSMLEESGYEKLIFVSQSKSTLRGIDALCTQHKPDVLIVDQIRNVDCGVEGLVAILETASRGTRVLAKKHHLLSVIVTQAGDSATDKLVLAMSDTDNSKTGLAATIDLMIGMGYNKEYEARGKRMISLPKNKISGDHGFFTVDINTKINRVL